MQNNGYQNLSLEFIDISSGGTATKLKENLSRIVGNKIVILGDIVLNDEKKLPVVAECNISVTLSEEPDDWDEEEDGEFIPENIYSVTFKNVYGYDISIVDNVITTAQSQTAIDDNIESIATDLIEGGTIENAKPIYCHPITLYKHSGSYPQYILSMLIFDNNPTAYTKTTLKQLLQSFVGRVLVSGSYLTATAYLSPSFISAQENALYLVGTDTEGNPHDDVNNPIDFSTLIDDATYYADAVNKIN